jgi:SAM-dependent methyltransferase
VRRDRALRTGRDAVAGIYHDAWPPFPEAVFDTIVEHTGLRPGARILEIGSGTGRATLALAERDFSIVALEPAPNLAAEARRRLDRFPRVSIEESFFEAWPLPAEPFDAVVSAQAFHWLDPPVAAPKTAKALSREGRIALVWRRAHHVSADLAIAVERAHADHDATFPLREGFFGIVDTVRGYLDASGRFVPFTEHRFSSAITYDAAGYLRHLAVYPAWIALEEDARRSLREAVSRTLAAAGGEAELAVDTVLFIAQKRGRAPAWGRKLPFPLRRFGDRLFGR